MSHLEQIMITAHRKIHTCQKYSGDQFKVGFLMLLRFCSLVSILLWYTMFTHSLSHWCILLLSVNVGSLSFFIVSQIELSPSILSFTKHSYLSSPIFYTSKNLSACGWGKTVLVKILNTPSVPSKPTSYVWNT